MNYLVKSSIAAFALCAVTAAYANKGAVYQAPVQERIGFKDGIYVAGYAGAQWSNFSWHGQGDDAAIDTFNEDFNFELYSLEGDNPGTQWVGAVALGYQLVNERLYLGFEVAGTFDGSTDSEASYFTSYDVFDTTDMSVVNNVQAKASLQGSEVDLDIKPGFIIGDNFLVYGRIGAAFNKLKMDSSGTWSETDCDNDTFAACTGPGTDVGSSASDSNSHSKNVVGIRLGAGIEYLVTEHFGISLDYLYTDYGTINSAIAGFDVEFANDLDSTNISSGTNFSEVHVTTQTAMLGLLYHF